MTMTADSPSALGGQGYVDDENLDGLEEQAPKKKGRKKFIIVPVLLGLLAGGYYLFLAPSGDATEEPKPGEVIALEPIQVNLAEGHYLKVGIALELSEEAYEVEGSKALSALIEEFSGAQMEDVLRSEEREKARLRLVEEIGEAYEGEVLDVIITDFVAQ